MADIQVLTESDLRSCIGLGAEELATIASVYPVISSGGASMPPIMRIDVPESNGEIDVKSAYLPGHAGIAVKVSAGFFDNPGRGLPSLGGLMILFDSETGVPRSALFDNGYLTDLRTALAGAVAAEHLARDDAHSVAIVGAGAQARLQLEALSLVRTIEEARIWARRPDRAAEMADDVRRRLSIDAAAVDSVATAAEHADIMVTATPSTSPVVDVSCLMPGLHITAIGSDAETKQELDAAVVAAADVFVCDSIAQSRRLGELRGAIEEGFDVRAVELGDVIAGRHTGRLSPSDVTVCDLTGTGAQDTAIASLAVERALARGLGTTIAV